MEKYFRWFLTFATMFAFLFSVLGFKVVKHTCNTCNTVEVNLFEKGDCVGCKTALENEDLASCCGGNKLSDSCGIKDQESACCVFEIKEAEVDQFFLTDNTSQQILISYIEIPDNFYESKEIASTVSLNLNYKDPPVPLFSGPDYLFFISQLKIPSC